MKRFVFLHGFAGGPELFDPIKQRVDPEALTPRILGHGARSNGVRTFEGEADRLAALVRSEGFEGASVLGYSLGGRLALAMIARHPSLFSSAALVGVNPGLPDAAEREARLFADRRWLELLEGGIDAFVDEWEAQPIFASQSNVRTAERERQRELRRKHDPRELARAMRVLGLGAMPSYWDELSEIAIPIAWVAGEHDAKFGAIAERAHALTRRSRVVRVRGAGHNPILEEPSAIAALLRLEPARAS